MLVYSTSLAAAFLAAAASATDGAAEAFAARAFLGAGFRDADLTAGFLAPFFEGDLVFGAAVFLTAFAGVAFFFAVGLLAGFGAAVFFDLSFAVVTADFWAFGAAAFFVGLLVGLACKQSVCGSEGLSFSSIVLVNNCSL